MSVFTEKLPAIFWSIYIKPKKDQCDRCVYANVNNNILKENEKTEHKIHCLQKTLCKEERDADRQNKNPSVAVLCYDLENVFTLPHMFASNCYYKRKLCVYNLTGTLILSNGDKVTYCALWNECFGGRSGCDIASALFKILINVENDYLEIKQIILWSDSCVPQNRNKITPTAILHFIHQSHIKVAIQKYSEPGHSQIQEVDCVHSVIERHLKHLEIPSQTALVRLLRNAVFERVKLKILEMERNDFKNFELKAKMLYFKCIPFTKIKYIEYNISSLYQIGYKLSHAKDELIYKMIKKENLRRLGQNVPDNFFEKHLSVLKPKELDEGKIKDLKSMMCYFDEESDRKFYEELFQ